VFQSKAQQVFPAKEKLDLQKKRGNISAVDGGRVGNAHVTTVLAEGLFCV